MVVCQEALNAFDTGGAFDRRLDLTGIFCASRIKRLETERNREMPKKTFTAEQIVAKLRQIEVLMGQGKTVSQAAKDAGITDQTFYRWRKEYGGLQIEQAKKFKDLQRENAQLRRAVADLTVEKQILKDIAEGNF
jgi:transposase-like protein